MPEESLQYVETYSTLSINKFDGLKTAVKPGLFTYSFWPLSEGIYPFK